MMYQAYLHRFVFFIVLFFTSHFSFATDESYVNYAKGHLKKGDTCTTFDDKFLYLDIDKWNQIINKSVDNFISFEVKKNEVWYNLKKSFECEVELKLFIWKSRDQQEPIVKDGIKLNLAFDTTIGGISILKDVYSFQDAYKVKVEVVNLSSKEFGKEIPDIFQIRNTIQISRQYPFLNGQSVGSVANSSNTVMFSPFYLSPSLSLLWGVFSGSIGVTSDNKLNITWNPADFSLPGFTNGPETYELEWTYIDIFSEKGVEWLALENNPSTPNNYLVPDASLHSLMKFNASRIQTSNNNYQIDKHFSKGFLIFRVRGVFYSATHGAYQYTNWQYAQNGGVYSHKIANVHFINTSDLDNKNWQLVTTFAEEGKKKNVVSYFDGMLKNRQTITRDNSNEYAIVGETGYDQFGRPTVSFLPEPVQNKNLKFYNSFYRNSSGAAFSYQDISLPEAGVSCTVSINPLKVETSGHTNLHGNNYYSTSNNFLHQPEPGTSFKNLPYIPNAFNKPYAVVEYLNDNTGRISRQGGVGPEYQIGSGKETRYFYGKPLQRELYRLFGSEVGISSHYLKNMVVDPNGQVSVSYLNSEGKIIATALAGNSPTNVDALPSSQVPFNHFKEGLISQAEFVKNAASLVKYASSTFLVSSPGNFIIEYKVDPAKLITAPGASPSFCSNCKYVLAIRVLDNCGTILHNTQVNTFADLDPSCAVPNTYQGSFELSNLQIGEYHVYYELKLDESELQRQTDYFIVNNSDLKKAQAFFEDELLALDLKSCFTDCNDCSEKLGGSFSEFKSNVEQVLNDLIQQKYGLTGIININTTPVQNWISSTYTSLLSICSQLNTNCGIQNPCDAKYNLLLKDVSPGGQYALYDPLTFAIPSAEVGVSIFNKNGLQTLSWRDDPQIPDHVFINELGQERNIKDPDLSFQEFILAYIKHPEWAHDFVKRHIEYCQYQFCINNSAFQQSERFDQFLRDYLKEGSKAVAQGYFSNSNFKALLDNNKDPFFAPGGVGNSFRNAMIDDLTNFSTKMKIATAAPGGGTINTKNINQFIDYLLYCKPSTSLSEAANLNAWNNCSPSSTCRSLDMEWNLYVQYYIQQKAKYVESYKRTENPNCSNCFVGADLTNNAGCASGGSNGVVPSCPSPFDFYLINERYPSSSNWPPYIDAQEFYEDVFLVSTNGPYPFDISFSVYFIQSSTTYEYDNYWMTYHYVPTFYLDYEYQVVLPAGETQIFIGQNSTSYLLNLNSGLYEYWAEGANFSINLNLSSISCPPVQNLNLSTNCSSDPNAALYTSKKRVYNDYLNLDGYLNCFVNPNEFSTQNSNILTQTKNALIEELVAAKDIWRGKLLTVRDEESFTSVSNTTIDNLVEDLYRVSLKYIEITNDISALRLVSTLPAGQNSSNGHNNFEQAFRARFGNTTVNQGFGPHVLEYPEPHYTVASNPLVSSNQIPTNACSNFSTILSYFVSLGNSSSDNVALHAFLKERIGSEYIMSLDDLISFRNACANNCAYSSRSIVLPYAFIAPNGMINCSSLTSKFSEFNLKYPNVVVGSKLYNVILANFLNQELGAAFSAQEYLSFSQNCTLNSNAIVFNQSKYPLGLEDPFACMKADFSGAIETAMNDYEEYIKLQRKIFFNSLVSACLNNNASVSLEGNQLEYHYTLYYYDESGNLVKTVPPAGVKFLDDAEVELLLAAPSELIPCANTVQPTSNLLSDLSSQFLTRQNANSLKSFEIWHKTNHNASLIPQRIVSQDNKYVIQYAFYNDHIWVELYQLSPNGGGVSMVSVNRFYGAVSKNINRPTYNHLVVQTTNTLLSGGLQVFYNGVAIVSNTPIPSTQPFDWGVGLGSNPTTIPSNKATQMHYVRLYRRPLSLSEIASNFFSECLAPVGTSSVYHYFNPSSPSTAPLLDWYRLNDQSYCTYTGEYLNVSGGRSVEISSSGTAPDLPSYVVTSVADNFTMEFWVKPTSTHEVDLTTNNYGGVYNQRYAIYPTYYHSTSSASAGISVGTNGVSVYEHGMNYMPARAVWTGTLNGWNHVAVVYTNKLPRIYVNGVLVSIGLASNKTSVFPSITVGGGPNGNLSGSIDEVRIWNYSRSPLQIQESMNRTLTQAEMGSLVAYYQIRGGDGNTLFDLSCNGRNLVAGSGFYNYNIFDHANVQDKRPIVKETKSIVPNHALVTEYKYNSLGQVFWQKTPDADVSEFFYDRLGRLVISQNAEQKLPMVVDAYNPANRFSYTKYDQLGRITEVGERLSSTAGVSADNTRNDSWLSSWMFSGTVRQSTRTLYDFGNSIGINSELANNNVLVNGRNRVVAVLYIPTGTNPNGRSSATYYSYDLMGNVKDLYQENIAFGAKQATLISNGSRLKRINYEYDLISGKVNYVHYQPGKWDQFHYYYNYDAENRLTEAWTSRVPGQRPSDLGDIHWTRDAQYSYYLHGPLSQMLLGKNLVQGLDYAYTLQGWLKGVNGQYLDPTRDMGKHGTGPLTTIPRDNLAFSLGYNQGDYSPIGQSTANAFTLQYSGAHTGSGAGVDLYNGNIRNTTYAIRGIRAGEPTAYAYRYDQLNRLKLHLSFGLTSNTTTTGLMGRRTTMR
jgi:hypothetical protein